MGAVPTEGPELRLHCGLLVPDPTPQERVLLSPPTCAPFVATGNTSWCELGAFPVALVRQGKSCPICAVTCHDFSDTRAFVVKDLSCSDQPKGVSRHMTAASICLALVPLGELPSANRAARAGRASCGVKNEVIGSKPCQLHQDSGFPQPERVSLVLQLKLPPSALCEVHSELPCLARVSFLEHWKKV